MDATRRSTLALAILALLAEAPMHPYHMQQLLRERGKDEVVNVRSRASLYQTITRLVRDGLVAVQETERNERRPERTLYALTDRGRETFRAWLGEMLAVPEQEFPTFPAALAHVALLSLEETLEQLERRAAALDAELAAGEARLQDAASLPRLFLIESEYAQAMRAAERAWVRALIDDLRAKRIAWDEEWLRQFTWQDAADAEEDRG